jgi:1-acyl-sn-glycerol-3-phosphate acyltransferase
MLCNTWYRIGRFLVRLLARAILEFSIQWKAPLPKGPLILAANHPSTVDPALITTLSQERVTVLIRESLFKVPLFGRSLRACGHIPVIQGCGQKALDEAAELLKAGRTVAIFPEGEISPEGSFHKPHSGLARLALTSGVPVVPIGIHLDQKQIHPTKSWLNDQVEIGMWYVHGPYAVTVGHAMVFSGSVENRALVLQVSDVLMQRITMLAIESARRVHTSQKINWFGATRWWLRSPVRLIRTWSAFEGVKSR